MNKVVKLMLALLLVGGVIATGDEGATPKPTPRGCWHSTCHDIF